MTVEQMKQKKQQLGYSCEQLSELSGISLEIIQNIFRGNEKEWSLDVLQQLEKIFKENVIDSNTISAPTIIHQKISLEISVRLHAFISQKKGACMVFLHR